MRRLFEKTLFAFSFAASLVSSVLRLSLPKHRGAMRMAGIDWPVSIRRDARGVPYINAETRNDLFFAIGFTQAQDRMWQMDLMRRAASGTLAELFGAQALPADRFMRRVGLYRTTQEQYRGIGAQIRKDLTSYTAGVNAYRATLSWWKWWRIPVEYLLLRTLPKTWKPQDSAVIAKFLGFVLSPNWDTQIVRTWLAQQLGAEETAFLEPPYPSPLPKGMHEDLHGAPILDEYRAFTQWLPMASASNCWAIDGTKTESGMPLLANDIHNPSSFPGLWYEMAAHGPGIAIAGASIPGLPTIIAGRNKHIAWGISSGMANQQDLYIEHINPRNPHQYRFENTWEDGQVLTEAITVRGQKEPAYEEILITRHGPLINALIPGARHAFALRSAILDSLGVLRAASKIVAAKNWKQFTKALSVWPAPSMNYVYADDAGNIGFQFAGFIPDRGKRSGLVPARGWCTEDEWRGYIPFRKLPSCFNPPTHFVVASNNRPEYTSMCFSGEWADPFRASRIAQLLSAKTRLSLTDLRTMHQDVYSQVAEDLLALIRFPPATDATTAWACVQLLLWNRRVEITSVAASIFEAFGYFLYRNVFSRKLGPLFEYYIGKEVHAAADINAFAYRSASNMVRILRDFTNFFPDAAERAHIIRQSMKGALEFLTETLGSDPKQWEWGKLHTISFSHALKQVPILGKRWSFGPYPMAGDVNTIPQASYKPLEPFEAKASVPLWRHLVDFAHFDATESVTVPGQSGHPASKNAGDQIGSWLCAAYFPLPFTPELVQQHAKKTLILIPKQQDKQTRRPVGGVISFHQALF